MAWNAVCTNSIPMRIRLPPGKEMCWWLPSEKEMCWWLPSGKETVILPPRSQYFFGVQDCWWSSCLWFSNSLLTVWYRLQWMLRCWGLCLYSQAVRYMPMYINILWMQESCTRFEKLTMSVHFLHSFFDSQAEYCRNHLCEDNQCCKLENLSRGLCE